MGRGRQGRLTNKCKSEKRKMPSDLQEFNQHKFCEQRETKIEISKSPSQDDNDADVDVDVDSDVDDGGACFMYVFILCK